MAFTPYASATLEMASVTCAGIVIGVVSVDAMPAAANATAKPGAWVGTTTINN